VWKEMVVETPHQNVKMWGPRNADRLNYISTGFTGKVHDILKLLFSSGFRPP
jgi:hypothetical protein